MMKRFAIPLLAAVLGLSACAKHVAADNASANDSFTNSEAAESNLLSDNGAGLISTNTSE